MYIAGRAVHEGPGGLANVSPRSYQRPWPPTTVHPHRASPTSWLVGPGCDGRPLAVRSMVARSKPAVPRWANKSTIHSSWPRSDQPVHRDRKRHLAGTHRGAQSTQPRMGTVAGAFAARALAAAAHSKAQFDAVAWMAGAERSSFGLCGAVGPPGGQLTSSRCQAAQPVASLICTSAAYCRAQP